MKNKKLFMDVDGCVRKFSEAIGLNNPKEWVKLYQDTWNMIDNDPKKFLFDCNAFEDVKQWVKDRLHEVVFLTNQNGVKSREEWTKKFLEKHFGEKIDVRFVSTFGEKIEYLIENTHMILIDDYPKFYQRKGFDKIKDRLYLMERSWNENVRHKYVKFYEDLK